MYQGFMAYAKCLGTNGIKNNIIFMKKQNIHIKRNVKRNKQLKA